MSKKILYGLKRIKQAMHRRSFLLRLLATTLLVAYIPLTIICAKMISLESDNAYRSKMDQLKNAASMVIIQFENMITSMNTVNIRLMTMGSLYKNRISSGVHSEINALEIIQQCSIALPFVKEYSLYTQSTGISYGFSGKMQKTAFTKYVLNISEQEFDSLLEAQKKAGFATWPHVDGNMLYIAPMQDGVNQVVDRYGIYLISKSAFLNYMRSILSDIYRIYVIRDSENRLIYQDEELENIDIHRENSSYIICSAPGYHGYTVEIAVEKSLFEQNIDKITFNARLLSASNILLCFVLISMVILWNYRPLARVVKELGGSKFHEASVSELDLLLHSYTELETEKGNLTVEIYEKNLILTDKLLENLLCGRKLTKDELGMLKLTMPVYRVVCAPLSMIPNVSDIIAHNSIGAPIYAIEMYTDGRLAFICGFPDAGNEAMGALIKTLRLLLCSDSIPLGFSNPCDQPERLFSSYLEAGMALSGNNETPDHFISHGDVDTPFSVCGDFQSSIDELTQAMKNADPSMLRYAEDALDRILSQGTAAIKRYGCYQLIDQYHRIGEAVDMPMDMNRLAYILSEASEESLRENLLSVLSEAQIAKQQKMAQANDSVCSALIQYLRDNYTDSLFGLNDLAAHMNVSVYTASRMVKTLTGISFKKQLSDMRIEHAKELLLSTELPIADVAQQSGFTSTSYFIKVFKESEGITPSRFRDIR